MNQLAEIQHILQLLLDLKNNLNIPSYDLQYRLNSTIQYFQRVLFENGVGLVIDDVNQELIKEVVEKSDTGIMETEQ